MGNTQKLTNEQRILPSIEFWIKPSAQLEQCCDVAAHLNFANRRLKDASKDLEHRALPSPIWADHGHGLPSLNPEVNFAQRPELARLGVSSVSEDRIAQLSLLTQPQIVLHAKPGEQNGR
jgi:hypothetical protein